MDLSALNWNQISNTIIGIILLPFSLRTVKSLIDNKQTLFDDDLTKADRTILKQAALFVLLPIVVLVHELGHLLACYVYQVKVVSFHWALFWGEVSWRGTVTPAAPAVIAAAGNLFQLACALSALLVALAVRSPAVVALATYTYLWAGFSCLVFYPLVSIASWDYDFAILYGSPDKRIVWGAALIHIILAWGFIYSFVSDRTKLWFAEKTRPVWAREFKRIKETAQREGTAVSYLALAWQYYLVGLDGPAEKTLQTVEQLDEENLDVWLLRGYIMQSQSKFDTADYCFEKIVQGNSDSTLRARAYMAKGHCLFEKMSEAKSRDMQPVLTSYKHAAQSAKDLADPHYYMAIVYKEEKNLESAEIELKICQNAQRQGLNWLDPVLANMARQELLSLRNASKEKQ